MDLKRCVWFFFLVLAFAIEPVVFGDASKSGNRIIAVVNDEVITSAELDSAVSARTAGYDKRYSGQELTSKVEEARREILDQMIENRLILHEAKRINVIVDNTEIEEMVNDAKSHFPSEGEFETELEMSGLTLDELKERYRQQVLIRKLVNHEVASRVTVTPAEIKEYYGQHSQELMAPESVRLRNIVLRVEEGIDESLVKKKAEDIMRLIKDGRDFSELATLYSQVASASEAGDMGFVEKGQLMEEIDRAVFTLKPGEVSAPIKTDFGYCIFKVEEKKESHPLSLSEANDYMEDLIFRQKIEKRYKEWIAKLKRDAFIQIKETF